DPPSGILATANARITPDGYAHLLANVWWSPYRTSRIFHLLEQGQKLKPSDMLAIQTDITSEFERFFSDRFVYAVDHAKNDSERAPRDLKNWHWGDQLPVQVQHPLFASIPVLSRFSGTGSHPQSGSGSTVKQVGSDFGPSERLTVDFSNLDQSTLNIVIGQSGHLLSPHYKDQFAAWYRGSTFLLPFSEAAVDKNAEHRLTLAPR